MPNPALVLLHARIAQELDALSRKFLHNLLGISHFPNEDCEVYGLVLGPDPHNPQVGTGLGTEAERPWQTIRPQRSENPSVPS